ncbi:MAG TPA: flagellar motor protein MotB [Acidimicrobiales bacterium]|nr:flagellar motor protein MotB [Acidimicrobiales bacterium]
MSHPRPARRRKRHEEHEEHENHERWLITYADMITLLMVLFIVLFAIGQTDLQKFEALKSSLNNALGTGSQKNPAIQGGQGVLAGREPLAPAITPDAALALEEKQAKADAVMKEKGVLTQVEEQIAAGLQAHGQADAARFRVDERGLTVTIVTDRVLFDPGSDALRPEGRSVLDAMGDVLANLPNKITIEGHTDDRPISSARFPTNWELSTARATSVLRYLVTAHGLAPSKLSASGYADQRPIAPNDNDADRAQNRRVEILVLSNAVDSQGGH